MKEKSIYPIIKLLIISINVKLAIVKKNKNLQSIKSSILCKIPSIDSIHKTQQLFLLILKNQNQPEQKSILKKKSTQIRATTIQA